MRSLLKRWEQLPQELQNDSVRPYYEALSRKRGQLLLKRVFDILLSLVLLVLLSPVMLILALAIRLDSPGEVLFRQVRVTQYGREFRIFKFRTMVANAQQLGTQVTVQGDMRITRMGKLLRKCRLDELPQLLNILKGDMSFVGPRPIMEREFEFYTPAETAAFQSVKPGLTGYWQAYARNDATYQSGERQAMEMYYVKNVSPWLDIRILFKTVGAVLRKSGVK